jgi:hypothetical protein
MFGAYLTGRHLAAEAEDEVAKHVQAEHNEVGVRARASALQRCEDCGRQFVGNDVACSAVIGPVRRGPLRSSAVRTVRLTHVLEDGLEADGVDVARLSAALLH